MEPSDRLRLRLLRVPPLAWAGAMIATVAGLGLATTTSPVQRLDTLIVRELQGAVALRDLQGRVFALTDLGGSPMLAVAVAAVLILLLVHRMRAALAIGLAVLLTKLVVAAAKGLVERPRPLSAFESYGTFSFPSGHAASAAALYMTLAVLLSRGHSRAVRATVIVIGAALTAAVGASRILLGAHFPTDVIAGWLTGGLLGLCAWIVVVRLAGHPPRPSETTVERLRDVATSRDPELPGRLPDDARV